MHSVIKFNQEGWLEPHINEKDPKNYFQKYLFKLMNNTDFGKAMENVIKHRDIKFVTTNRRRNYLVLEPDYHTKKCFQDNSLTIEIKRTQILMNKTVYFGISILEIRKIVMYELCHDYVKPKYEKKVKLCYMYTDSFIVYTKNKTHLCRYCKRCFMNYELEKPLSKGKKQKNNWINAI